MMNLPMVQALVHRKPLLLYLASSLSAIGALIAQEDGGSVEKPIYYISRALRDAETQYPKAKRVCLAVVYTSQSLCHYFLAYEVHLMMSQAIVDLLAQFPREEEFLLNAEVLGEMAIVEVTEE